MHQLCITISMYRRCWKIMTCQSPCKAVASITCNLIVPFGQVLNGLPPCWDQGAFCEQFTPYGRSGLLIANALHVGGLPTGQVCAVCPEFVCCFRHSITHQLPLAKSLVHLWWLLNRGALADTVGLNARCTGLHAGCLNRTTLALC
jgi:hypothetical protein